MEAIEMAVDGADDSSGRASLLVYLFFSLSLPFILLLLAALASRYSLSLPTDRQLQ